MLTDRQYARLNLQLELPERLDDAADRALEMLRADSSKGWTPSKLARKVKVSSSDALTILDYLVAHAYADVDDRGAWSHYWAR